MITIFYRVEALYLDDLMCYRITFYFIEIINVINENEVLNCFILFIAGFFYVKYKRE